MPGIFGVVNFNNNLTEIACDIVEKTYSKYLIDEFNYLKKENVYMAYAKQNFLNKTQKKNLPCIENSYTFIADAIVYNREKLIDKFNIDCSECDFSDSDLIIDTYKKAKYDTASLINGDFAFVIYDHEKKEAYICRDHVGKQALYYYFKDGILIFSSLMDTIVEYLSSIDIDVTKNEEWMANFLALNSLVNQHDIKSTIYNEIFLVKPATYMVFSEDKCTENLYWDLKNVKKLKFKSDKEYVDNFLEIFKESVVKRLNVNRKVAIKISGGLDSTSVAALAAIELKKTKKELLAYNFSYDKKYKFDDMPNYLVADEMEYVNELAKSHSNIIVESTSCEDKSSLDDIDNFINCLEQPYKIIENLYWGNDLAIKARDAGCDVLLSGQYGNITISFGDFNSLARTLFRENIFTFFKELNSYSKKYGASRKFVVKNFLKSIAKKNSCSFENSIINKSLIKKYKLEEVYQRKRLNMQGGFMASKKHIEEKRGFFVDLSYLGVVESKMALMTGIADRDPTRDKDLIEFCVSIPNNQYIRNGEDRYLIRRAMKGFLSDYIRTNYKKKGVQSVDWANRVYDKKENLQFEVSNLLDNKNIEQYINMEMVKNLILECLQEEKYDKGKLKLIFNAIIFNRLDKLLNKKIINEVKI